MYRMQSCASYKCIFRRPKIGGVRLSISYSSAHFLAESIGAGPWKWFLRGLVNMNIQSHNVCYLHV